MRHAWMIPAVAVAVSLFTVTAQAQTVVRVDGDNGLAAPTGQTPGDMWNNAFRYLSDALAYVNPLQGSFQIWVRGDDDADGIIYHPDRSAAIPNGSGVQSLSFHLRNSVGIYGGFAGTEGPTEFNLRDPTAYITVLSGDLDGDDGANFANYDENSHHVVTSTGVNAAAVIDGFTIRAGNALDHETEACNGAFLGGGGMINYENASPVIRRCIFERNLGPSGAGIKNVCGSNAIIVDCDFLDNVATDGNGGGIFSLHDSNPVIVNCRFIDNTSGHVGGAISIRQNSGTTHITNCEFRGNTADDYGGAVRVGYVNAVISNCTFVNNTVGVNTTSPTPNGGGLSVSDEGSGTPPITLLRNCIFWANTAPAGAGSEIGVVRSGGLALIIEHCDVEDRLDEDFVWAQNTGTLQWGAGNIGEDTVLHDPDFVNLGSGDLHLASSSPCLNAGSDSLVPADLIDIDGDSNPTEPMPWDHDGLGRFIACGVDMGAFENQTDNTCPGEATCNGIVNVDDLLAVINAWGPCSPLPLACPADLAPHPAGNGQVNVDDLLAIVNNWGRDCPTGEFNDVGSMTSVQDCMDAASLEFTPYSTEWDEAVEKCVSALCAAEIIDCD